MKNKLSLFICLVLGVCCLPLPLCGQSLPSPISTKYVHWMINKFTISKLDQRESFFYIHSKWNAQSQEKTGKALCNPERYFGVSVPPSQKKQTIEQAIEEKFEMYNRFFARYERLEAIFNADWMLSVYALTGSTNLATISKADFNRLEAFFQEKNTRILDFDIYENTAKGNVLIVHIPNLQIVFFTDLREIQIFEEKEKGPING